MAKPEYIELPGMYTYLTEENDTIAISDSFGTVSICSLLPLTVKFTFERFSPLKIQWSPKGSYLVGFNERGIMLMTASTHHKSSRKFAHNHVINCDFSPCERFMITYSCVSSENSQKMNLNIWDTNYTVAPIKTLTGSMKSFSAFKWSFSGSYLSCVSDENLVIYDLGTLTLVGGSALLIPSIQSISWSPVANELVFWEKSVTESPSQIVFLSVPSFEKRIIRQIFNLEKCSLFWDYIGTSLSLIQTRSVKKMIYHSFEIINVKHKDSSIDTIQLKTPATDFACEPYGSLLVVAAPPTIMIFRRINQRTINIKTMEKCYFHSAHWSPIGRILLLASITTLEVSFEVWAWDGKNMVLLGGGKHTGANYISWSPNGKYFMTTSFGPNATDNKVNIWSCAGYTVASTTIQGLSYSLWRPFPFKDYIKSSEIGSIWANIDQHIKQYSEDIKNLQTNKHIYLDSNQMDRNTLIPSTTEQINRIKRIAAYCKDCGENCIFINLVLVNQTDNIITITKRYIIQNIA
ncbi:hypothetical protein HZS_6214 [Henneguya salminicola]|nr:hypothetical protein HZS_6214 [Henneguya salminicola]